MVKELFQKKNKTIQFEFLYERELAMPSSKDLGKQKKK